MILPVWRRISDYTQLMQFAIATRFCGLSKEYFVSNSKIFFTYGENNTVYVSPIRPDSIEVLKREGYSEVDTYVEYQNSSLYYYLRLEEVEEFKFLQNECNIQNAARASLAAYSYAKVKGILNYRCSKNGPVSVQKITEETVIGDITVVPMLEISKKTGEIIPESLERVGTYKLKKLATNDFYLMVYCDSYGITYAIVDELDEVMTIEWGLIACGFVSDARVLK